MQKEYYTYAHVRNDTNKIFYIGKGTGNRAYVTRDRNKFWKRIVTKHGHTVDILAYWPTEAEAFEHEKLLIECFRKMGYNLTNQTDGGEGISGLRHNEETRAKMSTSKKGKKLSAETRAKRAYLKGRPQSEEHQQKIAEGRIRNKGKPRKQYSDEYKAKMSAIKKGVKKSPEHCKKIGDIHRGKIVSAETRTKLSVANTGKTWKMSEEGRAKISAAAKARPPISVEIREKISASLKARCQLIKQQKEQTE
jgi:hypothetical protein